MIKHGNSEAARGSVMFGRVPNKRKYSLTHVFEISTLIYKSMTHRVYSKNMF